MKRKRRGMTPIGIRMGRLQRRGKVHAVGSRRKKKHVYTPGVSVITCTNSREYIDNVFRNYVNQDWKVKELILILNRDDLDLEHYSLRAAAYPNVRVFQLPETTSLGLCLNFAVEQAKYNYVAKLDHDDYYGPRYLQGMMRVFRSTKADVAGKRSYYTYLEGGNLLIERFPKRENQYVNYVHGATFVIKKKVFKQIKFADVHIDDDGIFLRACRAKGLRICSAGRAHYVYIRRIDQTGHGWKVDAEYLLKQSRTIGHLASLEEIIRFVTAGRTGHCDFKALEKELNLFIQPSPLGENTDLETEVPTEDVIPVESAVEYVPE